MTHFTHQLTVLLNAGVPVVRSLEVLERQQANPGLRRVLGESIAAIRSGQSLSAALALHPRYFEPVYVSMIRAGEEGGQLPAVLGRLAVYQDKALRNRGKVAAAMTYPVIVMLVSAGIVAALLMFVVPKFEDIFSSQLRGQPLPALTRAVMLGGTIIRGHVIELAGVVVGMVVAAMAARRAARIAPWLDGFGMSLPVVGPLATKRAIARFTGILGTLLGSSVPLLRALGIARDTAGNRMVALAIGSAQDRVRSGESVAKALTGTVIGPEMVVTMIGVGEEIGALPEMLNRIAASYEDEVDATLLRLTTAIEPALIVLMAVVVGTIVIALFLPIVRIIQVLG